MQLLPWLFFNLDLSYILKKKYLHIAKDEENSALGNFNC